MTQETKQAHTPVELDICVSQNSNLVHIEEKVSGLNIATMTMKGAAKAQKIAKAMELVSCHELVRRLAEKPFYEDSDIVEQQLFNAWVMAARSIFANPATTPEAA